MSETGQYPYQKQGGITIFLQWWGRQLLSLIPTRLALVFGLAHDRLVLAPEDGDYSVYRLFGDTPEFLGRLSSDATRQKFARRRARGAECVLRIPPEQGLRRKASISVSALPRGYDAVAGEIERQTPFTPDQVYLGYRVEDAVDSVGRVVAHLSLAPCANTNAALKSLEKLDIIPDRVTLADDANAHSEGDTVHILALRRAVAPPRRLLLGLAVLSFVALASPLLRNYAALASMEKQLAQAEQIIKANSNPNASAQDPQAQIAWLAAQRGQRPPLADLQNMISMALPDTAYLAQFELSGRALSLQGVARAAPELIAPLEALPQVTRVEFGAPTLRDPATGLEQFQLNLVLRQPAGTRNRK